MSLPTLIPLGDRVLIRPTQAPTETESGLQLVEHWKPEQTGTVVAVGQKADLVTVGTAVIFSWSVGQEVFVNDGEDRLIVMRQSDLLAVIEPELEAV